MKKYAQKNIKAISSFMHFCRRTPPGVRGLKCLYAIKSNQRLVGRTPPGVRGLKFRVGNYNAIGYTSHPTRGAWIEIFHNL